MRLEDLMLRAVVFASGAVVMVVEVTGGRAITALYGSSAIVWGGVIGVVLSALSLGYWIGGRLSDRFDPRKVVSVMTISGGLYVALLPTITALFSSSFRLELLDERVGSVVSGLVVTGVPSVLLGAVVPATVKHLGQGKSELGSYRGTSTPSRRWEASQVPSAPPSSSSNASRSTRSSSSRASSSRRSPSWDLSGTRMLPREAP